MLIAAVDPALDEAGGCSGVLLVTVVAVVVMMVVTCSLVMRSQVPHMAGHWRCKASERKESVHSAT